jgi:hypothetical protein
MAMLHLAKFDLEAVPPGLQETNSPVFASLIDSMGKKAEWVILDLGPARSANLELLSRFRCKLFIEDAHELISSLTGDFVADNAALLNWLEQWTAGTDNGSIDVVLAWDIFNYLDARLCKTFVDHVIPLLKPGAHLYLLIYSQKEMPALPMQFKALSADKMECKPLTRATRPSPRFNQTDIKKHLREFTISKSVLLRNGMQEYLLRCSV